MKTTTNRSGHPPKKDKASNPQKEKDGAVENTTAAIEAKGKTKQYTAATKKPKKKSIF